MRPAPRALVTGSKPSIVRFKPSMARSKPSNTRFVVSSLCPAIWFSPLAPTEIQNREIEAKGYVLAALEDGVRLGAISLSHDRDVAIILAALRGLASLRAAEACFGVFPAPVQAAICCDLSTGCGGRMPDGTLYDAGRDAFIRGRGVPCYAAWNIKRSVGKDRTLPFEHLCFCCVGVLRNL